ncbi:electron transfer flavoprotein subunit beta/FixA family protein [Radiobacillus kanasensis]|uniref:electron transfer flavoprotein subunit beta/FixA family protein n=1 Tax=Radiobacillus kanasensis TaxID=2844358 RepID=UPI001E3F5ABF|nr:electron transfer flavoprotein subunit beta/FixA family protein [Radiobacillus kanasensis]UFT99265.1 electron transfer flavoprotein subunit beta/FixA family protein [Radiobacillus kanasensis]
MNIYVILKQTFDTEEKIAIENGQITEDGVQFVINPYDEYAVEEAIQIRDAQDGSIYVVSVGPERSTEALRTALAMGADEAVLISDERIGSDEYSVSKILASYLGSQSVDLVLGGYFSVDSGGGQVGIRLAELLDMPHVGSITELNIADGKATATRDAEGDQETVEVTLPALFTAQQGLNEPRYPSLPGIMKAKKKPFTQLSLDNLDISEGDLVAKTERKNISLPPEREEGRMLSGEVSDQVKELVDQLKNKSKVI